MILILNKLASLSRERESAVVRAKRKISVATSKAYHLRVATSLDYLFVNFLASSIRVLTSVDTTDNYLTLLVTRSSIRVIIVDLNVNSAKEKLSSEKKKQNNSICRSGNFSSIINSLTYTIAHDSTRSRV